MDDNESETKMYWIILIIVITAIMSALIYLFGKYILLPWAVEYFRSKVGILWT